MKKELSALEIGYLVKEFQYLISSKVDNIFNPEKSELLMCFFVPNKGKKILRILPNFIYLSEEKKSAENPTGFCMFLRKYLINSRLRKISQVGSERIIELLFETKDQKYILIIELFSKGNAILCDENHMILGLLESRAWKDRELKQGIKYEEPPQKANFYDLDEKQIKKLLENDKILVKKLAIDLSLGGVYAEEVCLLASIDKNKTNIYDSEIKKILKTINNLIETKIEPSVVYKEEHFFDVVPFNLEVYKDLKIKKFDNYSSAIDFVFNNNLITFGEDKRTKHDKQILQIENTIKKQEEKIKEIEEGISENEKKAELIYNNYGLIKDIIEQIKKATEKYSWNEIKEKLKDHKIIKEVNAKDKKVILELK